jgi:hypothetical protein
MIASHLNQLERTAAKGLALEFFLHEYVKALAIVTRLEGAMPHAILRDLEKLSSDSVNNPLQQPGILDRLCLYCESLLQTSKIGEDLLNAVDDLRISISKQRMHCARKRPPSSLSAFPVQQLHDQLRALFPLMESVLLECQDAGAALFALLELRETINRFVGPHSVESLFAKLFPQGPETLRNLLARYFERRGFDQFLQKYEALFEGLTWVVSTKSCAS